MPSPTSAQMCTIVSVRGPICIRPGIMSIHAHRPRDGTCCEPHGGLRPAHRHTPIHRYVDGDADGRVDEQANSDARGLSAGTMGHRLSVRGGRVYTKSRSQTRLKLGNAGRRTHTRACKYLSAHGCRKTLRACRHAGRRAHGQGCSNLKVCRTRQNDRNVYMFF